MKNKALIIFFISLVFNACSQNYHVTKERLPSSDEDPWTSWSKDKNSIAALLVLKNIREDLLINNIHDPHLNYNGYKPIVCDPKLKFYRSSDGTCYDLAKPYVGAAGVAFGRNIDPKYIDLKAHEKLMSPNPSVISKQFFTRDEFKSIPFLNMLAASWIQFMNHDWLTHGANEDSSPHKVSGADGGIQEIERTQDNRQDPSQYRPSFGKVSINEVTHWWDGSQIYGSSQETQNQVRSFSKGRMRTITHDGKELLPKNHDLDIEDNKQARGYEITGFSDNWWVGLSMLHHLFVKEHNAIAQMLYDKYVERKGERYIWNESGKIKKFLQIITFQKNKGSKILTAAELDEHIFQLARLINAAVMAKIHTVEWTPAILDNKQLRTAMYANWYGISNPKTWSKHLKKLPWFNKTDWFTTIKSGYLVGGIVGDKRNDHGVPFSITEEFTSVYRLHSLLPEELNIKRLDDVNDITSIEMAETTNEKSYLLMQNYDLEDLFYSFGTQHPGQLVLNNYPNFMQALNLPGQGQIDLGMVDILRDRERGVPRYNQFREAIGLKKISSYRDFFPDRQALNDRQQKLITKFEKVYGKDKGGNDNVDQIDLLVGTLAEEVRPNGFGFGETQFQIFILMASRRLMADPFFTDHYNKKTYTKAGINWIDEEGFLHQVIARHMPQLKDKLTGLKTAFSPWKK